MSPTTPPRDEKLVHGYNRMMERVKDALKQTEKYTLSALHHNIELAKEKAVELGELSREEAVRVGDYLRRDLEDAGEYLADSGDDLGSWLRFDVELVEERLWEAFTAAADQTKLAYLQLAQRAQRASEYHTGELTTVGSLYCSACGEPLHFHGTGHIPPCPKCHNTHFTRERKGAVR
jgi:NADH pyrophosphatase NudC (nudix superfamily)